MNHAALSGWVYLTLINLFKIATNGFLELITLVTEAKEMTGFAWNSAGNPFCYIPVTSL